MRAVKSDERVLWRETTRGVKPLRSRVPTEKEAPPPPRRKAPPQTPADLTQTAARVPAKRTELGTIAALDRRSAQRLKRGSIDIDARLDLHGMTQAEAHDALARFLARAQRQGHRTVLVITGKSGVLHSAVPRWLHEEAHRRAILAISRAHLQHGGDGALYLMLRRQR